MNTEITLKQLVDNQKYTRKSDIDLIKDWFIMNGKETEGIKLLADLSTAKSNKLERTLLYAQMWIPTVPDVYESNRGKVPKDVANKLNTIIQYHLLDMPLNPLLLEWAKETIPTLNTPQIIYVPAVEWLKSEYDIEFADKQITSR